ncbi:MAG: helix-turn-helix domain-containing protein [Lachnospiraceae bacterium]|nr:helix-turn-helix domain-containing protein [Lachnospiraceae bacterium]
MRTLYESMQDTFTTLYLKKDQSMLSDYDMSYFHYHNFHELYFLIDGSRQYIIGDELISVKKHDCVILKQGELHHTMGGTGFERFLIYFKDAYVERYGTLEYLNYIHRIFDAKLISLSPESFYQIQKLLKNLREESGIRQFLTFSNIITILIDNLDRTPRNTGKKELISEIVEYMNSNFREISSLQQIAEHFYITKEHLCRLFKHTLGTSVITYLNTIKIKHACGLLSSTNRNTLEIALESGFNSSGYFDKTFKKITGCTPREYKKEAVNF